MIKYSVIIFTALCFSISAVAQSSFIKFKNNFEYYRKTDSVKNSYRHPANIKNNKAIHSRITLATASGADCGYFCRANIVVPVTGLELTGQRKDNEHVQLQWKTYAEYNCAGFDLDRSFTGLDGSFNILNFTTGAGNSNTEKHYTKNDLNGYNGITYYRVKQKDLDGNFMYSNIVAVNGYEKEATILVMPNPGSNSAISFLISGLAKNERSVIKITDASGRTVCMKTEYPLANGPLPLRKLVNLPDGFYHAAFIIQNKTLSASFVVMK